MERTEKRGVLAGSAAKPPGRTTARFWEAAPDRGCPSHLAAVPGVRKLPFPRPSGRSGQLCLTREMDGSAGVPSAPWPSVASPSVRPWVVRGKRFKSGKEFAHRGIGHKGKRRPKQSSLRRGTLHNQFVVNGLHWTNGSGGAGRARLFDFQYTTWRSYIPKSPIDHEPLAERRFGDGPVAHCHPIQPGADRFLLANNDFQLFSRNPPRTLIYDRRS